MATDAQLVVAINANIKSLENQLKKANIALEKFDGEADRTTKRAARKISDNLAAAANDNSALRLDQWQNLSFQMNDVLTGLASGQRPMQVMAQQSGQIYQILQGANGGVSGALKEIGKRAVGLATPFNLAVAAITGAGAAAYLLGTRWSDAQDKIQLGLTGIGKMSGATVRDINDISEAASAAGRMSAATAREIATALASTGQIGRGQIGSIVGMAPGYAKLLGIDVAEAGKELAKLFSDPVKGADELNARLGTLDDTTRQYIRTLVAQGDRQGAILALTKNVQPELDEAAKKTSVWARSWNAVADAMDRVGQGISGAIDPTLDQQMSRLLEARKAAQEGSEPGVVEAYRQQGLSDAEIQKLVPSFDPQRVRDLTREIDALRKKMVDAANAQKAIADTKTSNQLSIQAGEIVRQYDAAGEAVKGVENQIVLLERAIADARTNGQDDRVALLSKAADSARASLGQLKKDYAEGGAAAAAALRQARFQQETAGLDSYQRGIREITNRFKELRDAAEKAGNVDALPKLREAEQVALAANRLQAGEKARAQVQIPQGYADRVMWIESRGNDNARNKMPGATATGAGQFTSGTWLGLFKKEFSELAATMTDAAILGLRTNRDYTVKMIEAYARDNGAAMGRAGFDSSMRNLYLAHFLGPAGAVKALQADPSANAASVLGADAAKYNPNIVGGGRTIGDMLAIVDKKIAGSTAAARSIREATIAEQQNTEAMGKSAAEAERLSAINKLLNEDREKGGELGQKFATAESLIKASSDQLTPALAAQREEWLKIADARAKAAASDVSAKLKRDLADQYAALGRTPDEQKVRQQALQYSAPGAADWDRTIQGLTKLHEVASLKDTAGSFLKGLTSDLMNGTKASQALTNQLKRLASTLADKAVDSLLSGLFDTKSGGGGLLSSIVGAFTGSSKQFADGGFTGVVSSDKMERLI